MAASPSTAAAWSGVSAGSAASAAGAGTAAFSRAFSLDRRRASWVASSRRSSGGSTDSAISPRLRW